MKTYDKSNERLVGKRDIIHIAILAAIALVIGVYLIATTVLISKDGMYYIERAQQFTSTPVQTIKAHPPGYPFLIMAAHKCAVLFTDDSSVFSWIYAAQSVTLLCRLLALIPLYFMGKLLVGSNNSFWALLIFIFLPHPTKTVCDVVREWPYLLLLATGFFFLLWSAMSGKWWLFGLVGLSSGLGYLIRHESAQLLVYGVLWGGVSLFRAKLCGVYRWKTIVAIVLLFLGFAIPAAPYMKCTGKIIPPKVKLIMKSFSFNALPDKAETPIANADSSSCNTAGIVSGKALEALSEILKKIGETLMWFFVPILFIGFGAHFRQDVKYEEWVLVSAFILVNLAMMVLRYCYIYVHASQRWTMPLIAFTIFYIPVGLRVVGNWLDNRWSQCKQKADTQEDKRLCWFVILFLIGIGICMPKLLRPVGIDKHGYREAAKWLRQNTDIADVIAVRDRRPCFYAERKGLKYGDKVPMQAKYVIRIETEGDQEHDPKLDSASVESYSGWVNKHKKKKRIVIYEVHPKS